MKQLNVWAAVVVAFVVLLLVAATIVVVGGAIFLQVRHQQEAERAIQKQRHEQREQDIKALEELRDGLRKMDDLQESAPESGGFPARRGKSR